MAEEVLKIHATSKQVKDLKNNNKIRIPLGVRLSRGLFIDITCLAENCINQTERYKVKRYIIKKNHIHVELMNMV
ncbi:hypothetical protein [Bacillus sp. Au-Bac7]|uniref:hypothetical protein n=1 Tax=Bacillus sp. Au-Bac7 TaxID=2906458 RepID=UPI001E341F66|nr:hypothetical protein [Bacillus sp. Au-Bac7]MCE4051682.1 hypothetical protein [Bacillus sp. Au-Bac7]